MSALYRRLPYKEWCGVDRYRYNTGMGSDVLLKESAHLREAHPELSWQEAPLTLRAGGRPLRDRGGFALGSHAGASSARRGHGLNMGWCG